MLALLLDTVTAAVRAEGVRRVLVVCEDARVPAALRGTGVDCVDERGLPGLNAALSFGAGVLRERDAHGVVGALQADLPALRPAELAAAVGLGGGRRAFCADRPGTGTTLLLSAPGGPLEPRFGPGSAARARGRWRGHHRRRTGLAALRCRHGERPRGRRRTRSRAQNRASCWAFAGQFTRPFGLGCPIGR